MKTGKRIVFYVIAFILTMVWTASATESGIQAVNYVMTFIPAAIVFGFIAWVILEKKGG
jgi:hypothetical protein